MAAKGARRIRDQRARAGSRQGRARAAEMHGAGSVVPLSCQVIAYARAVDAGVDKPLESVSTSAAHSHAGWGRSSAGDQTYSRSLGDLFVNPFGRHPKTACMDRGLVATVEAVAGACERQGQERGSEVTESGCSIPAGSWGQGRDQLPGGLFGGRGSTC